jgi:citrate synthase
VPSSADSSDLLTLHELIHEDMKFHFEGFPPNAHPMAILSSMINAAGCYYPDLLAPQESQTLKKQLPLFFLKFARSPRSLIANPVGCPLFIYPKPQYKYSANLLHMMFSVPYADYELKPEVVSRPRFDFPAPC